MPASDWKQEVNQRLAAHKNRKGLSTAESAAPAQTQAAASSRATQAAARVAARYAQAPSYSQMQAAEARAALRTAEIATQAALDANVAAQAALAGFEAASANAFQQEADAAPALVQEQTLKQAAWEPVAAPAAQAGVERPLQAPPQAGFCLAPPGREPCAAAGRELYLFGRRAVGAASGLPRRALGQRSRSH